MKKIANQFERFTLVMTTLSFLICLLPATWAQGPGQKSPDEDRDDQILTIDHLVPHVSTVPANAGERVELFLREKVRSGDDDERDSDGRHRKRPVVITVSTGTQSALMVDVPFEDYSWMVFLARAGFDVFALDVTGYGLSPRPTMDDPCNASQAQQTALLIPNPLSAPCKPSYPFKLTTSQSDWDEIDTVVEYVRQLRGVDKVNLLGWSLGGPRLGGYAARHPEKVERLFLDAPNYNREEPSDPPDAMPEPGVPLQVRTVASFFATWDSQVHCDNQFTPGIRDALRATILQVDPLGSTWGTEDLWRAPNQSTRWGWNPASAARIEAPTLIIRGDLDTQVPEAQPTNLYADLQIRHKVFVHVACAAHQLVWENRHMILLRASAEWFREGTFAEQSSGSFFVDAEGIIHPE